MAVLSHMAIKHATTQLRQPTLHNRLTVQRLQKQDQTAEEDDEEEKPAVRTLSVIAGILYL